MDRSEQVELFHELYGGCYRAAARILEACQQKGRSRKELEKQCKEKELSSFAGYVLDHMEGWGLLKKKQGLFYSSIKGERMQYPLSHLQKSWLKALLGEEKIGLFFDREEIEKLTEELKEIEPLYQQEYFDSFDKYTDGDTFLDKEYIHHFKIIYQGLKKDLALYIQFNNRTQKQLSGSFLPLKLEYSPKDDKIRLYAYRIGEKQTQFTVLNLSRITQVELLEARGSMILQDKKIPLLQEQGDPVLLRISKERNALERTMLHFANYKKRTEYDEKTGEYLCRIYYDKKDETELLIRVLSFGPMVRVLGPEKFLEQVRYRVQKQMTLLSQEQNKKRI